MSAPFQVAKPLPDDVRRALIASVKSFGVLVPIIKDQHGRIIDGHHRAEIADELDVDVPVEVVEVEDDEHARTLAVTLNADRRQMSADERRQVVARLRSEGHSIRATAEAVGTSKSTVSRDLATVPPGTVAQSVGLDGRERPASEDARLEQREKIAETIDRNPTASDRWVASQVGASDHTVASVRAETEAEPNDDLDDPEGAERVGRWLKQQDDEVDRDPTPLHAIAIVQAAERQLEALDAIETWPSRFDHLLGTVRAAVARLTDLIDEFDRQEAA